MDKNIFGRNADINDELIGILNDLKSCFERGLSANDQEVIDIIGRIDPSRYTKLLRQLSKTLRFMEASENFIYEWGSWIGEIAKLLRTRLRGARI